MKRVHIPIKLYKEIEEYCKFNNISSINKEIESFLRTGFNLVKFGSSPFIKKEERQEEIKLIENVVQKDKIIVQNNEKKEVKQETSTTKNIPKQKIKKGITIIKN